MEFVAPAPGVVEVRVGGVATERYTLRPDGTGEQINPGAPMLVSQAIFATDSWSRTYRGQTVTFALNAGGDLIARRSGVLEDWQAPEFTYALNPRRDDLAARLRVMLERVHEEADRWEGHDHTHGAEGQ